MRCVNVELSPLKKKKTFVVLEGTLALAAECLGAKCQANNAGKEMKSKLCCNCRHQSQTISSTIVAHLCLLPHSFSSAS